MAEKNKNPEIRFKGFTDDWEPHELGELLGIRSASRVHKNEWTESGVPFFRSSDVVADYKGMENNKAFISFELYEKLSNKSGCVQKNDLLVTGGGSIGIPYLVKSNEPLYFKDADLLWLKNANNINSYFLYTFFSTLTFRHYVNSITHIGTISHYTIEQAKSTPIKVPRKEEQDKIGEYLANIDKLITFHQRKHEKLVTIKKAMLDKMLPKNGTDAPEIRFKGFTEAWEERSLGEEATIKTGYPFDSNDFDDDGEYLVITNGNIQNDSPSVNSSLGNRIEIENNAILSEYVLNPNDILVTMDGTVGRTAKVLEQKQILAQRVGRLIANSEPEFLYQLLNTGTFFKEMALLSHGGTIKHISLTEISCYRDYMPSYREEKEKIGTFFQNLDNLITLHQRELEKLEKIKKACFEKMFV